MTNTALLYLSFGGPEKADDVVPFLENVTRGRGIPKERLKEVGEHYFTLGGRSPINEQNTHIIDNITAELAARNLNIPVYFGNRNWHPYIENTLQDIARAGITHVYVFATSAWGGYSGCAQYQEDIRRALDSVRAAGLPVPTVERLPQFHSHPTLIALFAEAVDRARDQLGQHAEQAELVFTAHSVPNSAGAAAGPPYFGGDLYSQQVLDTARMVQQASSFANQPGSGAGYGWTGQLAAEHAGCGSARGAVRDGEERDTAQAADNAGGAAQHSVGGRADGPAHTGAPIGMDCSAGGALDVELTWQSRSGSPHIPWLEPDICDHIEARAEHGNTRPIVLCPVGFITDHIEVMWDLDTEAKNTAADAGIPFVRADTPGLRPEFAAMVVDMLQGCIGRTLLVQAEGSFVSSAEGIEGAEGVATQVGVETQGSAGTCEETQDGADTQNSEETQGSAETQEGVFSSQVSYTEVETRTAAQEAAAQVVKKYATVPDFGNTQNGRPCAPGCCGTDPALCDADENPA